MAQLKSPLMSQDASGRCFGNMQIGHWKGRHVIGRRRRPRQPRTEPQRATRLWQTFLAREWAGFDTAEKASWDAAEGDVDLPAYNQYLRFNTNLYKNMHSDPYRSDKAAFLPAAAYPPARDTAAASWGSQGSTPGTGWAEFHFTISAINDNWVVLWNHVPTASYNATFRNLIAAVPVDAPGLHSVLFENLPAGLFRVGFVCVSRTGNPRDYYNFLQATVS